MISVMHSTTHSYQYLKQHLILSPFVYFAFHVLQFEGCHIYTHMFPYEVYIVKSFKGERVHGYII